MSSSSVTTCLCGARLELPALGCKTCPVCKRFYCIARIVIDAGGCD